MNSRPIILFTVYQPLKDSKRNLEAHKTVMITLQQMGLQVTEGLTSINDRPARVLIVDDKGLKTMRNVIQFAQAQNQKFYYAVDEFNRFFEVSVQDNEEREIGTLELLDQTAASGCTYWVTGVDEAQFYGVI